MGTLRRMLNKIWRDKPERKSSFAGLTAEQLNEHLKRDQYGGFRLTDAVRPAYDLKVVPKTGFRYAVYQDEEEKMRVPVIMASVSKEDIFNVFMEILDLFPGSSTTGAVLETSHSANIEDSGADRQEFYRDSIDLPVLKSILLDEDFRNILLDDGCTGIAILNADPMLELQLEEHKLLIVYGWPAIEDELLEVFKKYGVKEDPEMEFITDAEHIHNSDDEYIAVFERLKLALNIDGNE